jgi:uncharacterized membrane protein YphA (DoxX/SURF4 family)
VSDPGGVSVITGPLTAQPWTLLLHNQEGAAMSMKAIGYWVATLAITSEQLAGGVTDLVHGRELLIAGDPVVAVLARLGYPIYLLAILGWWKILGAIVLIAPGFPRLKEWAYAGTFFELTGAAASAALRGDSADLIPPLVLAIITIASWALRPPSRTLGALFPVKKPDGASAQYDQTIDSGAAR